jgi:hypothetical protein
MFLKFDDRLGQAPVSLTGFLIWDKRFGGIP